MVRSRDDDDDADDDDADDVGKKKYIISYFVSLLSSGRETSVEGGKGRGKQSVGRSSTPHGTIRDHFVSFVATAAMNFFGI